MLLTKYLHFYKRHNQTQNVTIPNRNAIYFAMRTIAKPDRLSHQNKHTVIYTIRERTASRIC
uniref:Uncharacterized protein n=1 Tax=Anguilla anguilla TaxID=7936 RepID=A0A0E9SP77_ANGAN